GPGQGPVPSHAARRQHPSFSACRAGPHELAYRPRRLPIPDRPPASRRVAPFSRGPRPSSRASSLCRVTTSFNPQGGASVMDSTQVGRLAWVFGCLVATAAAAQEAAGPPQAGAGKDAVVAPPARPEKPTAGDVNPSSSPDPVTVRNAAQERL